MTWAMGTKITIFSIAFMMIFAVVPPSFADETIVVEDSIDTFGEINQILLAVKDVDEFSVLTIVEDCANTSDPARTLDPRLQVLDPDGLSRNNDDGFPSSPLCGGGFRGSILVYSGVLLQDGVYTINPTSFCAFTGSGGFGCPGTGFGPYTVTITLTGAGQISTEFGIAPPSDPPNDVSKGKKDFVLTPQGACDALSQNPGKGQGKARALANICGVVAEDDTFEFIESVTFENVLDNDLNKLTGDNTGLTVTGISDLVDSLPAGSDFVVGSPNGSFGVLCAPGVGTLTFTYTVENVLGNSDTADVTITCVD